MSERETKDSKELKDPFIGQVINDRYNVLSLIGTGGMGNVYLAEHTLLKKKIALKILHLDQSKNKDTLERFKREAIAASNMGQSNIVDVTDFGYTEQGNAFFVMEYVDGQSLADIIKEKAPLPAYYVIAIGAQISLALYNAHSKGIIHRDLKPENILVTKKEDVSPFIKIVDFGISKMLNTTVTDRKERTLTKTGAIFGTPEYMSPEQGAGKPVDSRSDIYSTGIIMYEMLTGRLPFADNNYMKVLHKHQYEIPELPSTHNPSIISELDSVVMKCIEKNVDNRYQSMMELLAVLKSIYAKHGFDKNLNLAFLFNSTTISRVDRITNEESGNSVSGNDIVKMLNKGTMAEKRITRQDDYDETNRKKSKLAGLIILLLILAFAGVLTYIYVEGSKPLVVERSTDKSKMANEGKTESPDAEDKDKDQDKEKSKLPKIVKIKQNQPVAARTILLTVNSNLKDVTVLNKETGQVLCKTPCRTSVPRREGGVMILGFKKDEYEIKPMVIRLDRDISVNVQLKQDN